MRLVFDQSSPVHPHFSIQGGWGGEPEHHTGGGGGGGGGGVEGQHFSFLMCSVPTVSHCSVTLGHFWNYSSHGISQIQWSSRAGLAEDCLFSLAE